MFIVAQVLNYNNKLDLDKLYSETNNHYSQYNNSNGNIDYKFPHQFAVNNNVNIPNQNISYHQNNNFHISDLTKNNIGENYSPLDIKDYNIQKDKTLVPKNEKDHFNFVNDLFKKKK